jgi:hypothetical protein
MQTGFSLDDFTMDVGPDLSRKMTALRAQGQFPTNQDLLRAAFDALERNTYRIGADGMLQDASRKPYMSHPGLSPDDYDT